MKKLYMILAAVAAMTFGSQAQNLHYGVIEVGDYDNAAETYNGSFFDMAPTNFYLAHTGAQLIYTTDELAEMSSHDVNITKLTFKFLNDAAYEDMIRDVKLFLQETDATEFEVVEGVKQFFTFDNPVIDEEQVYPMIDYLYEDMEVVLDLSNVPFTLHQGKNLLVTVVFDAQDDDNCTSGSFDAPFYTSGIRNKGMVYTDNHQSFIEFAQGDDFPDATAMLGCGTNVDLPVTLINYSYEENLSAVEEIEAVNAQNGAYYNLMGQKFTGNMPAGIYIHNGKKVIVK